MESHNVTLLLLDAAQLPAGTRTDLSVKITYNNKLTSRQLTSTGSLITSQLDMSCMVRLV